MTDEENPPDWAEKMRRELRAVLSRHCEEGDVTYAQSIGVLEILKYEVFEHMKNNPDATIE